MVTVETALAFPILLLVVLVGGWILHVGQTQARLTEAARTAAREAARGTDVGNSVAAGQRVLPAARITVLTAAGDVVVSAETSVTGPGPWLGVLSKDLRAEVVTRAESP